MPAVIVSAPARLHVTLCDLGRATHRAYGGVGFAIQEPRTEIRVSTGSGNVAFPACADEGSRSAVTRLIKELGHRAIRCSIDVDVLRMPAQHSGLGSKTSLLLSVLYGTNELLKLGLSRRDMQLLSGRGGTSGVGVHSFFTGGMIWDGGHRQADVKKFGPSSDQRPATIPPCLAQTEMPPEWRFCLLDVPGATPSGDDEIALFGRGTPVPADETLRLIGCVVHGILPAVAERDLSELARSLNFISRVGFKARELAEQSPDVQSLLCDLHAQSIPAGMSSLGPTIFAVGHIDDREGISLIESVGKRHGAKCSWTRADNRGATVSVD